jgi:hypothetical protein
MEQKYQVYRVIAHLQNREAYDKYDLAFELEMHPKSASRHLKELWMLDLLYICGWEKEHQSFHPVYRWGNKPDVERPEAVSGAERSRRYRERKKNGLGQSSTAL